MALDDMATIYSQLLTILVACDNRVTFLNAWNSIICIATSKTILVSLFRIIPEDIRRKEYQEAAANVRAEEEAQASQQAADAEELTSKLKTEGENTTSEEPGASPMNEAQASLENLLTRAKGLKLSTDFSWDKFSTQLAAAGAAARNSDEEEPTAQIATVRGQAKAKKLAPQRAVVKPVAQKVKQATMKPAPKKEVRPVFGGLFKQETIYVDED